MNFVALDARIESAPEVVAMLQRQAHAWTVGDFSAAAADWHPEGVLTAPGNRVPYEALERTIKAFHRDYGDLIVTITNVFASADGRRIALEWLWEVSRRSDGARSRTEDAILIDLDAAGKILSWREYFDTASAVEDHHTKKDRERAQGAAA
jgi:ketosteroid isomerase-like protein